MSLAHCMANKLKEFIESTDSELTVIDRVRSEAMLLLFSHGECASHSQDFSKKKKVYTYQIIYKDDVRIHTLQ